MQLPHWPLRKRLLSGIGVALISVVLVGGAVTVAQPDKPLPPDKQAGEDVLDKRRATGMAIAAEKSRSRPTGPFIDPPKVTPVPTTPPEARGLHRLDQGLPFNKAMMVVNAWSGYMQGDFYTVFAGAVRDDWGGVEKDSNRQGMVKVVQGDWRYGTGGTTYHSYLTPTKAGAVTITAVSPTFQLTLLAADGTTSVFDLPTRTFVGAPGRAGTPVPSTRPQARGFHRPEQPLPAHEPFIVENAWSGFLEGDFYTILAGAVRDDPTQGWVRVVRGDGQAGTSGPTHHDYVTPTKAGSVRLTMIDPTFRVVMQARDMTVYVFDLTAGRFVRVIGTAGTQILTPPASVPPTPTPR